MATIDNIGAPLAHRLQSIVYFTLFVGSTFKAFFKNIRYGNRLFIRATALQIIFTAVDALPITFLLSVFIFSAVVKQIDVFVPQIGAGFFIAQVFVILIVRELAPLIVAFVVIARSGTAIASEISSMMVHDEVNSLRVLGIDPLYLIVAPRIIGITVSLLCLSFFFTVTTILGGMLLVNYYLFVPIGQYLDGIFSYVTPLDVAINVIKSFIFGLTISFVCCYYGMSTRYSPTEIPQVTTKAVIDSLIWCFVISAVITIIFY
jgi:phospholipid/cholesterol/gamma-HCH transport system permease protein